MVFFDKKHPAVLFAKYKDCVLLIAECKCIAKNAFHERTSLFSLTSPFIYDTMDLQKNHVANATFRRILWKI